MIRSPSLIQLHVQYSRFTLTSLSLLLGVSFEVVRCVYLCVGDDLSLGNDLKKIDFLQW